MEPATPEPAPTNEPGHAEPDRDSASEPAPGTLVPRSAPKPGNRRLAWGSVAAVVVVALLGTWLWFPADDDPYGTRQAVRDYLDTIREGDVDRALELAGEAPEGEAGRFLTAGALDRGWGITKITEVWYSRASSDYSEEATVAATITGAAGEVAIGEFDLARDDPEKPWQILNPLLEFDFSASALWYVEVNGVKAPYEFKVTDNQVKTQKYWLLPGVYKFYSDVPELLDVNSKPAPYVGRMDFAGTTGYGQDGPTVLAPAVALTDAGTEAVQQAVNDHIDGCARISEPAVAGCPFGVKYLPDPRDADYYLDTLSNLKWTIKEYPVVVAVSQDGGLLVTDRQRGIAVVTADGIETTDSPGVSVEASLECPIETSRLQLGVLSDGTFKVAQEGARFWQERDSDTTLWETC